jgi:hypothetical protein
MGGVFAFGYMSTKLKSNQFAMPVPYDVSTAATRSSD